MPPSNTVYGLRLKEMRIINKLDIELVASATELGISNFPPEIPKIRRPL
jgi:hypothetical protein